MRQRCRENLGQWWLRWRKLHSSLPTGLHPLYLISSNGTVDPISPTLPHLIKRYRSHSTPSYPTPPHLIQLCRSHSSPSNPTAPLPLHPIAPTVLHLTPLCPILSICTPSHPTGPNLNPLCPISSNCTSSNPTGPNLIHLHPISSHYAPISPHYAPSHPTAPHLIPLDPISSNLISRPGHRYPGHKNFQTAGIFIKVLRAQVKEHSFHILLHW